MILKFNFVLPLLIFLFIIISVKTQEIREEKIYSLLLTIFKNDTVILENISVEMGVLSHFPTTKTGYYVKIISYTNETLFESNLGISFKIHYQIFPGEKIPNIEIEELEKILVSLRLPYFENADRIEIYHDDKLIFTFKICNFNNICELSKGENIMNCMEDCFKTTKTPQKTSRQIHTYLVIFGLILGIIIFLFYKIKVVK